MQCARLTDAAGRDLYGSPQILMTCDLRTKVLRPHLLHLQTGAVKLDVRAVRVGQADARQVQPICDAQ